MTTLRRILKESITDGPPSPQLSSSSPGEGSISSKKRKRHDNPSEPSIKSEDIQYPMNSEDHEKKRKKSEKHNIEEGTSDEGHGPTRGYRDKNDYVCAICEKEGDLLLCDGPCLSSFHIKCLGLSNLPGQEKWFCKNCQDNTHSCFLCKQEGKFFTPKNLESSANIDDHNKDCSPPENEHNRILKKCRAISCGKFYHLDCIQSHPLSRIVGDTFICPLHTCASCETSGKRATSLRCTRCPTAYHSKCAPRRGVHRIMSKRIVCNNHADSWHVSIPSSTSLESDSKKDALDHSATDATLVKEQYIVAHDSLTPEATEKIPKMVIENKDEKIILKSQLETEETNEASADEDENKEDIEETDNKDIDDDADARNDDSEKAIKDEKLIGRNRKLKKEKKRRKKKRKKKDKHKDRMKDKSVDSDSNSKTDFLSHRISVSSRDSADEDTGNENSPTSSHSVKNTTVTETQETKLEIKDEPENISPSVNLSPLPPSNDSSSDSTPGNTSPPEVSSDPSKGNPDTTNENRVEQKSDNKTEVKIEKKSEEFTQSAQRTEYPDSGNRQSRAAAAAANTKILSRAHKYKKHKGKEGKNIKSVISDGFGSNTKEIHQEVQWVQCDRCKKWRTVASGINVNSLPERWYCSMNTWDASRAVCEAPEEEFRSSPMKLIQGSHANKNILERNPSITIPNVLGTHSNSNTPTGGTSTPTEKAGKEKGRKRKSKDKDRENTEKRWVQCEHPYCGKWRIVPPSFNMQSLPGKWYCNLNTWHPELASCSIPNPPEEQNSPMVKRGVGGRPKGSGRQGRLPKKLKNDNEKTREEDFVGEGHTKLESRSLNVDGRGVSEGQKRTKHGINKKDKKTENCLWVQCERCEKWRKLPSYVTQSTLPEKWYCHMNKWDPLRADCSVDQEDDQEVSDAGSPAANFNFHLYGTRKDRGKLCYRELLFGSNGLLRKAYTDDMTSILTSSGKPFYRDDQYRDSSMYCSPKKRRSKAQLKENGYLLNISGKDQQYSPTILSHKASIDLKELILDRLSLHESTLMELVVSLHCEYDSVRRNNMKELPYFSFGMISASLEQLVSNGEVEKLIPQPMKKGYRRRKKKEQLADGGYSQGPGRIEAETEPIYRKPPKKPLKSSKPWKYGKLGLKVDWKL